MFWKCPICDEVMINEKYEEEGKIVDEINKCKEFHYKYEFGYGRTEVTIGKNHWYWRYDHDSDKYLKEIDEVIKQEREKYLAKQPKEPEKIAFLKALKENKYDKTTRLVFADWLEDHGYDDEATLQREWTEKYQKAEDWLVNISTSVEIPYEDIIQAGFAYRDSRESFTIEGSDEITTFMYSGNNIELYWKNWEIVTGEIPVGEEHSYKTESPFRCSC